MKTIASTIATVQSAPEKFTAAAIGQRDAAHNTYTTFRDSLGFNAQETIDAEREWKRAIAIADAVADIVAGKEPHTSDVVELRDSALI
jgi:hypothetical protein